MTRTAPASSFRTAVLRLRKLLAVLVLAALALFFFQWRIARVPPANDAMVPAAPAGSVLLYDALYRWHLGNRPVLADPDHLGLAAGDIVLLASTEHYGPLTLVSRVVAVAGESVRVQASGGAAAPGRVLEAAGRRGPWPERGRAWEPDRSEVPSGCLLVLNDNPDSPMPDSRRFGWVPVEHVRGRVLSVLRKP